MRYALLVLVLALVVGGCSSEDPVTPNNTNTATIVGTVFRSWDMQPMSGVTVSTAPPTSTFVTTTAGTFEFKNVMPGAYIVTAQRAGVDTQSVTITAMARQTTNADIVLQAVPDDTGNGGGDTTTRFGRIEGRVTNLSGASMPSVIVQCLSNNRVTVTDGNGRYVVDSVPAGLASMIFQLVNGQSINRSVTVTAGQTSVLNVTIDEAPELGLIGHWPLNGNAFDVSGNGHNGEIKGGVSPARDRKGIENGAMYFGTSMSHIRVPHSQSLNSLPLTLSCWVRPDQAWMNVSIIISKFLHPSGEGWDLFTEGGILGIAYMRNNYSSNTRTDIPKPAIGWIHVCAVFTEQGSSIYLDGEFVRSTGWQGQASSTTTMEDLFFGGVNSTSNNPPAAFRGWLDDIKIYRRPLNDSEIRALAAD